MQSTNSNLYSNAPNGKLSFSNNSTCLGFNCLWLIIHSMLNYFYPFSHLDWWDSATKKDSAHSSRSLYSILFVTKQKPTIPYINI